MRSSEAGWVEGLKLVLGGRAESRPAFPPPAPVCRYSTIPPLHRTRVGVWRKTPARTANFFVSRRWADSRHNSGFALVRLPGQK